MAHEFEVELDEGLKYIQYASEVIELVDEHGMNFSRVGRSLGIDPTMAKHAYKFGKQGLKTTQAAQTPDTGKHAQQDSFRQTQGPEVARRRDELDQPFHVIAEAMGVTRETARKAYLHHHRQLIEKTGDLEKLKDLGCNRRISLTKLRQVREMLKAGHTVNEVSAEVGCSKTVIYREKRELD
jgi:hypothetical protein